MDDCRTVKVNAAFGLCWFREAALYFFESDGESEFETRAAARPLVLEAEEVDFGQESTV